MLYFKIKKRTHAQSVVEYLVVITSIIFAMILMQKFILRGIMGKYRSASEQIDYGRQFDPNRTVSCLYVKELDVWLPEDCVREHGGNAFECDNKCQNNCSPGICEQN